MRLLVWLLRAFLFFTLFAFALNNLQPATLHWFFGLQSQTPLVIVVLVAFAAGCAAGVLAMVPSWWRHRTVARRTAPAEPATRSAGPATTPAALLEHPPREGL